MSNVRAQLDMRHEVLCVTNNQIWVERKEDQSNRDFINSSPRARD